MMGRENKKLIPALKMTLLSNGDIALAHNLLTRSNQLVWLNSKDAKTSSIPVCPGGIAELDLLEILLQ